MRYLSQAQVEGYVLGLRGWFTVAEVTDALYPDLSEGLKNTARANTSKRLQKMKKDGKIQAKPGVNRQSYSWEVVL